MTIPPWSSNSSRCSRKPRGQTHKMIPMKSNPLEHPDRDSAVLRTYCHAFGLSQKAAPGHLLRDVASAFTRLPYENLTKIIKQHHTGTIAEARRAPGEVLADHLRLGTGGT